MAMEAEAGCSVTYYPQLPLRRYGGIARANTVYQATAIRRTAHRYRSQIIHTHSLGCGLAALRARHDDDRFRVVADFHGAAPEEHMFARGLQRPDKTSRVLAESERTLIRDADGLVLVSDSMKDYFASKYALDMQRSVTIPCCTDLNHAVDPEVRRRARSDLGLSTRPVIAYLGSAEEYQMPEPMCALFTRLKGRVPDAFFLVLSHDGPVFERCLHARGLKSEDYKVVGAKRADVPRLLCAADVGLLLRGDSVVNHVAFPTKFAEYCAAGVPVVTTPYVGDVTRLVQLHDVGIVVEPEDVGAAETVGAFLKSVMKNRTAAFEKCEAFVSKNLDWSVAGDSLCALYEGVTAARNGIQ